MPAYSYSGYPYAMHINDNHLQYNYHDQNNDTPGGSRRHTESRLPVDSQYQPRSSGPHQFGQSTQQYAQPVSAAWGTSIINYGSPQNGQVITHGRRNSIAVSEASTGASPGPDHLGSHFNGFESQPMDDSNDLGYMPSFGLGEPFDSGSAPPPFDIIPGPSSQIVSTHNRIVRENLFMNRGAHTICMTIIEVMSMIRLKVSHTGTVEEVDPVDRDNVLAELEVVTAAAAPELQTWIRAGSQRRVGTTANVRVATARRVNRNGTQLFWCTWCGLVTTTKNNLGNHIRSHLGFHISFCKSCPFSSVTSRIPDRHKASCGRRGTGF